MPPKRSKPGQAASSSQPRLVPARATRSSNRKRRHSDASVASEAPSAAESVTKENPTKKRKRSKPAAIAEAIAEEEPTSYQVMDESDDDIIGANCEPPNEAGNPTLSDEINADSQSSKQVRFDTRHFDPEVSTAAYLTPHPRKMTIKRRVTLSPGQGGAPEMKRFKTTFGRRSLPANLSHISQDDEGDFAPVVQELQFAPLRSVLDERIRRRLRRSGLSEAQNSMEQRDKRDMLALQELEAKEVKLRELALELETQRQFAMDVSDETTSEHEKLNSLKAELSKLKAELADLHAAHAQSHMEHEPADDNMMVLDTHFEVNMPQMPSAELSQSLELGEDTHTGTQVALSGSSSPPAVAGRASLGATASWEAERRRFEDAIVSLSREANDAKSELQILHIELGAIGFGGAKDDPRAVLASIRNEFGRVREDLAIAIPGSISEDASNQDIVEILLRNVNALTMQLRQERHDISEKSSLITDLSQQVQGLISRLADAEIRKSKLEQGWKDLDSANETQARELEDLEEDLGATQLERDEIQGQLDSRVREVESLDEENATMIKSLEKLTLSLENYRREESRLTELIAKMEEEHREDVTKMNEEREQTVRDLDARLDTENSLRVQAEEQIRQREQIIVELESHVEGVETGRDMLIEQLAGLQESLESEQSAREEVEGRIENLELELEQLNEELQQLRELNDAERQQCETAQAELNQRNEKLHQQGIEANQLRQKLFEAQQTHEVKVEEMQQLISERDEQYQDDFADEVRRREELEARLHEIEAQMRADVAARDRRAAELETALRERDEEIASLRSELQRAERDNEAATKQHDRRVQQMQTSITSLGNTISENEELIAELESDVAGLKTNVSDLEAEKAGLERRVEQEAEQMLELQNEKGDEIQALKSTIRDKQQKILIVEEKAVEADRSWQEVLDARDQEIAAFQTTTREAAETNMMLQNENASLKKRFQQYIRRSKGIIETFQAAVLTAQTVIDKEGDVLKAEGDSMLEELERMDDMPEVAEATNQRSTRKKTRSRAKRQQDSGIGMDDEEAGEDSVMAEV